MILKYLYRSRNAQINLFPHYSRKYSLCDSITDTISKVAVQSHGMD